MCVTSCQADRRCPRGHPLMPSACWCYCGSDGHREEILAPQEEGQYREGRGGNPGPCAAGARWSLVSPGASPHDRPLTVPHSWPLSSRLWIVCVQKTIADVLFFFFFCFSIMLISSRFSVQCFVWGRLSICFTEGNISKNWPIGQEDLGRKEEKGNRIVDIEIEGETHEAQPKLISRTQ